MCEKFKKEKNQEASKFLFLIVYYFFWSYTNGGLNRWTTIIEDNLYSKKGLSLLNLLILHLAKKPNNTVILLFHNLKKKL